MLNDGDNLGSVCVSLDGRFLLFVLFSGSGMLVVDFRRNGFGLCLDNYRLWLGFGFGLRLGFGLGLWFRFGFGLRLGFGFRFRLGLGFRLRVEVDFADNLRSRYRRNDCFDFFNRLLRSGFSLLLFFVAACDVHVRLLFEVLVVFKRFDKHLILFVGKTCVDVILHVLVVLLQEFHQRLETYIEFFCCFTYLYCHILYSKFIQ